MKLLLLFSVLIISFTISCEKKNTPPKNVILFIGDGMGIAHVTALTTVKDSTNLERFNNSGFIKTHAIKEYVTDSGASATAYATGQKTYNGAISVSEDKKPLKTVLEYAEELGKSTGLVATSGITHATPASFAAHVDDRGKHNEIAFQMSQSGVDVLFGGRLGNFLPQFHDSSFREDDIDVVKLLQENMNVVTTLLEFQDASSDKPLAYLYSRKSPPRAEKRLVPLKKLTKKALDILSQNPNGFFLMVEGSQIDWGAHDVDKDYLISEMLDFDDAIGVGLNFAKKNKETLVIVTADHETGGLALLEGSLKNKILSEVAFYKRESTVVTKANQSNITYFNNSHHTAEMVPIFAYGPLADIFGGIHDNTFVGKQLISFNQ